MNAVIGMQKELNAIRAGVEHNLPILMVGETGVGKTFTILEVAKEQGKEVIRISLNGEVGITELLGKYTLNKGDMNWQDGVLVNAMRNGHWVVLDEMNAALPEVLFCLNSLMDDSRSIVLAEKDGEKIMPHKDFRIFATINPCDNYVGTKEINPALMSRFPIILWVDYPTPATELAIIKYHVPKVDEPVAMIIVDVVNDLRKARRDGRINIAIGIRDAVNWAKIITLCDQLSLEESLEWAIINKAKKEEWKIIGDIAAKATELKINWKENAQKVGEKLTRQVLESIDKLQNRNEKLRKALAELEQEITFVPPASSMKTLESPKAPMYAYDPASGTVVYAAEAVPLIGFKVGDHVKFKSYEEHGDWRSHRGQVGILVEHVSGHVNDFRVKWSDGKLSGAPESNLIIA